jgi:NADH-quinone oxidoreductase subunit J
MQQGLGLSDPFITFVASAFFWVAAVVSVVAAYVMVTQVKNLVRAAMALTAVLGSVAAVYGVLAADFLMVVQLVVYVGAIAVLIIFAIFMTPGQVDVPGLVGRGQQLGAMLVAGLLFVATTIVVFTHPWERSIRAQPFEVASAEALGGLMLTTYVLPFEILSLLLTVALIGAVVIARED